MSLNRHAISLAIALAFPLIATSSHAADVVVQPSSGSGFVVKDAAGANERLRVQESGAVSLPSVVAAPAQTQSLCMSASGQLGPCSGGGGSSYTAATGLSLTGTTFSVAPTYRLPQSCTANQIAQWDGTAWICGDAGESLPAGTVNQTLRYDTGNTLVANNLLQAFADGGLVAGGEFSKGSIPATGSGARLMWYPAKYAFRVGEVRLANWDDANIGYGSIAAGYDTLASGGGSTAMGEFTHATSDQAVAMGYFTTAAGAYSVAIGDHATADANNSTAIGRNVSTNGHKGSFIYGDASVGRGQGLSVKDNDFVVFATGGVRFYLSDDGASKAYIAAGDSAWNVTSDRNAKTAIVPVDGREVLEKVIAMPLSTWRYKSQEAKYRHMGPMAQDFYAAFQLGDSDKSISTVDADGVALAAIQGLNTLLAEKDGQIASLRAEVSAQAKDKDEQIAELRAELTTRVAALESLAGDLAEMKAALIAPRQAVPAETTVALQHQPR